MSTPCTLMDGCPVPEVENGGRRVYQVPLEVALHFCVGLKNADVQPMVMTSCIPQRSSIERCRQRLRSLGERTRQRQSARSDALATGMRQRRRAISNCMCGNFTSALNSFTASVKRRLNV